MNQNYLPKIMMGPQGNSRWAAKMFEVLSDEQTYKPPKLSDRAEAAVAAMPHPLPTATYVVEKKS